MWPTEDPLIIESPSVGRCHVRSASAKMTLRGDDLLLTRNNGALLKRCRWSPVSLSMGHGGTGLKIRSLLLVVVVLSPLWMMPLSVPVFSDVVVVMYHDSAVNTAVRTITENVPDIRVVEYGSLEYAMTIHRVVGRVVWVSHGSEDGILAGSQLLSWRVFSSITRLTLGRDIVLACYSEYLTRSVESTRIGVLSIGGIVDAVMGGLVASSILTGNLNHIGLLVDRYRSILSGGVQPEILSIQEDWASIRVPIVTILTGLFFVGAYYTKWHTQSILLSILSAIIVFGVGIMIGFAFQVLLEFLFRGIIGAALMAINPIAGKGFNALIGSVIGYVVSSASPFKMPSFISAVKYLLSGSTVALAISDTPDLWVRVAACSAAAIGIIAIVDAIIQLM
ncbi:MAG: hypothetical protein ACP6IT_04455 [Candidatus Thorarchaeota archaeon]